MMESQHRGWRGRGRSRGRSSWSMRGYNSFNPHRAQYGMADVEDAHRSPSPPLGKSLKAISTKDLADLGEKYGNIPAITDCKYAGSYSWLENEGKPTILVPGIPPTWTPLDEPKHLKEDAGTYYRDPNAARYPEHPSEPAVRALLAHDASLPVQDIDVFACGSTIGNLLRFVRKLDRPFRFTVEAVGNTVFFVRREKSPTETLEGVRGYGHTFPEAYTTWEDGKKGSQSHQRLVKYDFAGLNCVVRFESDGYLKHLDSEDKAGSHAAAKTPAATTKLNMETGGRFVPQDAVFDLKTRSVKRMDRDVLGEEIQRLWVSQIPNFILAYHERGVFRDIRVRDVRRDMQKWETENEDALSQLAALIREIVAMARSRADGRLEVRRKEVDVLEMHEQTSEVGAVLPDELKERWNNAEAPSGSSSDGGLSSSDDDDEQYFSAGSDNEGGGLLLVDSDDESEKDYTACSAEDCGYCGHCRY